MTIDLTDTTTGAISNALTEARRRLGGMTLGMVLTLIIVTDEEGQYDAIRAANHGRQGAPVPRPRHDHPPAQGGLPAGRRDPGRRGRAGRDDSCCGCTARSGSTRTP